MKYLFYSLPAYAFAIPTFPVMVFLPALYSEVYGMDIATIGIILFAAKLIDITTDPLMGWINDKNFFSRKVWLIIGGLLSGIALYKLFKVDEIPGNGHLLIWIVVLYTGWTIFQIPYLSIGYNLEENIELNRDKTIEMFNYCDPNRLKRIIYFSTASILTQGNQLNEVAKTDGIPYVQSKYYAYEAIKKSKLIRSFYLHRSLLMSACRPLLRKPVDLYIARRVVA